MKTPPTAAIAAAAIIAFLPTNWLRCSAYRRVFGYVIRHARVGWGTVICVARADLDHCVIGRFNRFVGPMTVSIGAGADIESHNVFDCGAWTADEAHRERYSRTLRIGAGARITNRHFFDVAGEFSLGEGSWIAGRGSQFWTHGVNVRDRDVSIGKRTYIGSSVRFAPGSSVGDDVVVGIGSVVLNRIAACRSIVSGFPAHVVKEGRGWSDYDGRRRQPGAEERSGHLPPERA